ncbi:MAG TPA: hypothetical protein PKD85_06350 [Saprospiraceae bacterium]|nr:hypothetical protein [Saprospiraceae bacterium]
MELSILNNRIDVHMPIQIKSLLDQIGRTEDIRFSEDKTRVAIAGFIKNYCLILKIQIESDNSKPILKVLGSIKITSRNLKHPHGIEFIGNDYLIAANRTGSVEIFDIRHISFNDQTVDLKPISSIQRAGLFRRINSPGSVAILNRDNDNVEILVCNNYGNKITHHRFPLKRGLSFIKNKVFLYKGLKVPDGIAITHDKKWLAISNHYTNSVLIFDLSSYLSRNTEHVGELINSGYPHGIRFTKDGCKMFVADAGSPYVYEYQNANNSWKGTFEPKAKYKVLTEDAFLKGRSNLEEGGPKGIDIIEDASIFAISNEETPFDLFHFKF